MYMTRISLLTGQCIDRAAIYRSSDIVLYSVLVDSEGPGTSEVCPVDVGRVGNLRSLERRA